MIYDLDSNVISLDLYVYIHVYVCMYVYIYLSTQIPNANIQYVRMCESEEVLVISIRFVHPPLPRARKAVRVRRDHTPTHLYPHTHSHTSTPTHPHLHIHTTTHHATIKSQSQNHDTTLQYMVAIDYRLQTTNTDCKYAYACLFHPWLVATCVLYVSMYI